MEIEVDYIRIYRPMKSSSSVDSGPEVGVNKAARDEYVVLDLLEGM